MECVGFERKRIKIVSMKRVLLLAPIFLAIVAGCKKDFKKEENLPIINFISPVQGGVYTTGDTVPVKATFGDDTKVQAFSGDINRQLPVSSIFNCAKTVNSKTAVLDTFMVIPSALNGTYQFDLYCEDPYNNFIIKSITFTANLP